MVIQNTDTKAFTIYFEYHFIIQEFSRKQKFVKLTKTEVIYKVYYLKDFISCLLIKAK